MDHLGQESSLSSFPLLVLSRMLWHIRHDLKVINSYIERGVVQYISVNQMRILEVIQKE